MSVYRITLEKEVMYKENAGFVELIKDYVVDDKEETEETFREFLREIRKGAL